MLSVSPVSQSTYNKLLIYKTILNLDLQNTALGYGFHFQHRHSRTFPNESLTYDSGRTLVCAEYGYPKGSPNTNAHPNNLIVNIMKLPDNRQL
jgi:hypothetical protein